ncbi:LysR family transcriptional regulator [Pseudothauera nasutitermitis]|nr:LysR family transcriptional regulator [Pseudothauera nasutitermitis]
MKEPPISQGSAGADRVELLRTFVRIVESGSLSAAAPHLGTTQPTVSRRLQALERTLGLVLLQRSTHGMKLTGEGERCYAHARDLIERWQAMELDLGGARDEPRGHLRVLVPHAFGQDQLMAPLTDYLRRYPEVSVEWLLHDRRPDFVAEGIDCAVQVGEVADASVVAVRLAEVPRIVAAAPGAWGDGAPPTRIEELAAMPWLALRTYYCDEVALTRADDGRRASFPIRPRLSTDSLYALCGAARAGLGACVVSAWMAAEDVRHGRLCHLLPEWEAPPLPVYLAYPHARHYPAKLRAFNAVMRAYMPTLTGMRAPTPASAGQG